MSRNKNPITPMNVNELNNADKAMQDNVIAFNHFYSDLLSTALARFEWVNLPNGLEARRIEELLLFEGSLAISKHPLLDIYYSTPFTDNGKRKNNNNNPIRWILTFPFSGKTLYSSFRKSVIMYNSNSRFYELESIRFYANELANLSRVRTNNANVLKTPIHIQTTEEESFEATQYMNALARNQPYIISTKSLDKFGTEISPINSNFLGREITEQISLMKNEALTFLGISNSGLEKSERMTANEVESSTEEIEKKRLNLLNSRRLACKKINEMFDLDIQVYYAKDNISDNYNFSNNQKTQAIYDVPKGGDVSESINK